MSNQTNVITPLTILSKKELKNVLGFKSDTSIYNLAKKDNTFPQAIRIGLRKVGYRADEVYSWLESRKVDRDKVAQ